MKQIDLAKQLRVSEAYISMVLKGKKKPSKKVSEKLKDVNFLVKSVRGVNASNIFPRDTSIQNSVIITPI